MFEDFGARSDEGDAGGHAGPRELGVLGEEAVTGVDGIDADFLGERDDARDVQVGADRFADLADAVGFVRLEAVQGEAVFVRVDRDGANVQFVGRAEDANRDFASIGDEELAKRTRLGIRHDRRILGLKQTTNSYGFTLSKPRRECLRIQAPSIAVETALTPGGRWLVSVRIDEREGEALQEGLKPGFCTGNLAS